MKGLVATPFAWLERRSMRFARRRARRDLGGVRPRRGPRVMQIGLTDRCNYRCLMCTAHSPLLRDRPPEQDRPQLPFSILQPLIAELGALEVGAVDLVGVGEPLLHPQFMEVIALLKEAGLSVLVSSNGALLTPEKARRLVELGLNRLNVSINAGTGEAYEQCHPGAPASNLSRILECLQVMRDHKEHLNLPYPQVSLSVVLNRLSYRSLREVVQACADVGASHLALQAMGVLPETQELALDAEGWHETRETLVACDRLAEQLGVHTNAQALLVQERPDQSREVHTKISCYAGHVFALVWASGQVRFCCGCDAIVGNLHEHSFQELWEGAAYQRLRRQALALPFSGAVPEGCSCHAYCPHALHNVTVHNWRYPRQPFPAPIVTDQRFSPNRFGDGRSDHRGDRDSGGVEKGSLRKAAC